MTRAQMILLAFTGYHQCLTAPNMRKYKVSDRTDYYVMLLRMIRV